MKPLRANSSLLAGLFALALFSGCEKKPVAPAPQAQAPVPAASPVPDASPVPTDQEAQQTQTSHPPSQGTPPPDPSQVQAAEAKPESQAETQAVDETADKSKEKSERPSTPKKRSPQTARNTPPPKVVVKPDAAAPSPTPGQISPGVASSDVSHDQASTEQLLQSSESNLGSIKRQLSQDEQDIVAHIRDYINQSRQAIKENDLVRARNLALKAHLLSDDLVKRR